MILPRHTSRGPARTGAMAILFTLTAACAAPLTHEEQLTVERYLVCFECPAPLQDVRRLAGMKPRATVDSLDVALRRGPTVQRTAEADSLLNAGYTRDSTWRSRNARPALPPRDSVVAPDSRSYVDGYRARGALGMGWIRTARALRYLDQAIATGQLPPSVLAAARFARDSIPSANGPPSP
ncbi:MAG: hypothetical protein K8S21_11165 [Gemmatimonadetes bacterium]|nr:hypothetical protein [Gemmatimonadota bacterium]